MDPINVSFSTSCLLWLMNIIPHDILLILIGTSILLLIFIILLILVNLSLLFVWIYLYVVYSLASFALFISRAYHHFNPLSLIQRYRRIFSLQSNRLNITPQTPKTPASTSKSSPTSQTTSNTTALIKSPPPPRQTAKKLGLRRLRNKEPSFPYCKITNPQPQFNWTPPSNSLDTIYASMTLPSFKEERLDSLSYAPPEIVTPSSHSLSSNLLDIIPSNPHDNNDNSSEISDANAIYPGRTIKCYNCKAKIRRIPYKTEDNHYMIKSTNIYIHMIVYSYTHLHFWYNDVWLSQRGHISFMSL